MKRHLPGVRGILRRFVEPNCQRVRDEVSEEWKDEADRGVHEALLCVKGMSKSFGMRQGRLNVKSCLVHATTDDGTPN